MSSRIILDGDQEDMIDATKEAMKEGVNIYQAALEINILEERTSFIKLKVNQILVIMLMRFGMQN